MDMSMQKQEVSVPSKPWDLAVEALLSHGEVLKYSLQCLVSHVARDWPCLWLSFLTPAFTTHPEDIHWAFLSTPFECVLVAQPWQGSCHGLNDSRLMALFCPQHRPQRKTDYGGGERAVRASVLTKVELLMWHHHNRLGTRALKSLSLNLNSCHIVHGGNVCFPCPGEHPSTHRSLHIFVHRAH